MDVHAWNMDLFGDSERTLEEQIQLDKNDWMELNLCNLLTDETSDITRTLLIILCTAHMFRASIGDSVDNIHECCNVLFLNCAEVIRDSMSSDAQCRKCVRLH